MNMTQADVKAGVHILMILQSVPRIVALISAGALGCAWAMPLFMPAQADCALFFFEFLQVKN